MTCLFSFIKGFVWIFFPTTRDQAGFACNRGENGRANKIQLYNLLHKPEWYSNPSSSQHWKQCIPRCIAFRYSLFEYTEQLFVQLTLIWLSSNVLLSASARAKLPREAVESPWRSLKSHLDVVLGVLLWVLWVPLVGSDRPCEAPANLSHTVTVREILKQNWQFYIPVNEISASLAWSNRTFRKNSSHLN